MTSDRTARIALLNDILRTTGAGGEIVATRSVAESPDLDRILDAIRRYNFTTADPGNNPYGENDFGVVEVAGGRYYFKVDYYDMARRHHSPDESDPKVTRRVLTIMSSDEY